MSFTENLKTIYGAETDQNVIVSDLTGIGNITSAKTIVIDTTPPTVTITAANYNADSGKLTLTGDNMDSMNLGNAEAKTYLDWSKLRWDIDAGNNSDDPSANVITITVDDIESAKVVSGNLEITFKSDFVQDKLLGH